MPRAARLDAAGLLQHVMVRGIERRDIFLDEKDRHLFLGRFSKLLQETGTVCLAWALMNNHFHLLLRPMQNKLAMLMRRLLTGYAVTFNRRHKRVGHLFQNRYKSIVCEEEPYLLELVRYIHLNPLRAGLVKDMTELDHYMWSGHSVLMGNRVLAGQEVKEVLANFGRSKKEALNNYREFAKEGASVGRREDLSGGGKRRSLEANISGSDDAFDERVLGSGEFVQRVTKESDLKDRRQAKMSLAKLVGFVAREFGIKEGALGQRNREKLLADARAAICYLAVREMGHNGEKVAGLLNISRSGVSAAARRGETVVRARKSLSNLCEN
jgi:REP element-mobilizing transposase RayT